MQFLERANNVLQENSISHYIHLLPLRQTHMAAVYYSLLWQRHRCFISSPPKTKISGPSFLPLSFFSFPLEKRQCQPAEHRKCGIVLWSLGQGPAADTDAYSTLRAQEWDLQEDDNKSNLKSCEHINCTDSRKSPATATEWTLALRDGL